VVFREEHDNAIGLGEVEALKDNTFCFKLRHLSGFIAIGRVEMISKLDAN
jgi:hypothetical protein